MDINQEIERRRTFGIVSHPDAGKTTLTEKFLLYGGGNRIAGAVKSNKIKKGATSDFMEIERQRGISVATSVMGFEYNGYKINILDTPGHQDFAEDTYRTLTAVDSVIVVVDAAKGVEAQTEKLMKVCRMRQTPVIIFINKMDRETKDPFELLDELEEQLEIKVRPLVWPAGSGRRFKGIYDIIQKKFHFFTEKDIQNVSGVMEINDLSGNQLDSVLNDSAQAFRDDIELIDEVYPPFENKNYLEGKLAPVFFGSALYNFGVRELLNSFLDIAPTPKPSKAEERIVKPEEDNMSGFVFKIHANMDPNHRNRLAFVKICSGVFRRNTNYKHIRLSKQFKFSNPTAFMAQKKSVIDEAYPGDIVGLHDSGNFKIGDTLTSGETLHFKGLPSFSPEQFKYIENAEPLKSKQLNKGIDQLMDEGVAQLFTKTSNGRKIIGTVGQLQFEVIEYRLKHEYGAISKYEPIDLYKACWVSGDTDELETLKKKKHNYMAVDKHGREVFLAESHYALELAKQNYPHVEFHMSSEF